MSGRGKLLKLLHMKSCQVQVHIHTHTHTHTHTHRVLKRVGLEQPDAVQAQKQLAARYSFGGGA